MIRVAGLRLQHFTVGGGGGGRVGTISNSQQKIDQNIVS